MTSDANRKNTVPRKRMREVDPLHPCYELDVWLIGSDPPIWRSVIVPADLSLLILHHVLQCVMGWDDVHLHRFETKSKRSFRPIEQIDEVDAKWATFLGHQARKEEDEAGFLLRDLFDELKETMAYVYDFGDDWTHGIKLIGTREDASVFEHVPLCIAGERCGPPEDSGGVWGYQQKLAILKDPDPDDEWHQDVIDWMGGRDFDPEEFDIHIVNARLARLARLLADVSKRQASGAGKERSSSVKKRKRKSR